MTNLPRATAKPVYVADEKSYNTDFEEIKGRKAIVNEDDNSKVYSIMSDRYAVIQYDDALNEMERAINKNPEFGTPARNITLIDDGAKMKVDYDFPKLSVDVDPKVGDLVNMRLTLQTAYDGSTMFSVLLGGMRLICKNGMVGSIQMANIRRIHCESLRKDISNGFLEDTIHQFSMQAGIWKGWVDKIVGFEETKSIMEAMEMGQKDSIVLKEDMEREWNPEAPVTKWMLFNLITAFITHKVESEKKRLDLEYRARKAFYAR